ncbi:MAG: hypothetical protein ACKO7R_02525, partial [Pseudanabaena sp.]
LTLREFDIAICGVLRTQMAKNGKNRLAILTIFHFRRIDVYLQRFALISKCRKILKVLLCNAFKIFLVVYLLGNYLVFMHYLRPQLITDV